MKNKISILIILLLVISLFVSCKDETEIYRVSFYVDGEPMYSHQVPEGSSLNRFIPVSTDDDFAFDGWYLEESLNTKWDFSTGTVTSDLNLYGEFKEIFTVYCFAEDAEGEWDLFYETDCMDGYFAQQPPADPVKTGYIFTGWVEDGYLHKPFDFSLPITQNFFLEATYSEIKPKVTFHYLEETSEYTTSYGEVLEEGFCRGICSDVRFDILGFYADENYFHAYDFSAPLTDDVSIYVKTQVFDVCELGIVSNGYEIGSITLRSGDILEESELDDFKTNTPYSFFYNFNNWCTDHEGIEPYDFSLPVTTEFTLYGCWTAKSFPVRFENGGHGYGTMPESPVDVQYNSLIPEPDSPTDENYNFTGWYTDEGQKWNFATDVLTRVDLRLTARWEAK